MTTIRQIEANRRNALKSTGPRTEEGKRNSSRNAVRHGLTCETVIRPIEDEEDYKAFETSVTADYLGETAVERELVLRLASLLWRLRRATSIETSLFQIQENRIKDQSSHSLRGSCFDEQFCEDRVQSGKRGYSIFERELTLQQEIAARFIQLTDGDVFERLGRYEAALWRQVRQILFTLDGYGGCRSRVINRRHTHTFD